MSKEREAGNQGATQPAAKPHRRLKIALGVVVAIVVVLVVGMATYFGDYYHAVGVDDYLEGTDEVAVSEVEGGWLFDGEGTETALIFYPGAKVEATSYAPLMYELAQAGVDCFLVEMPLNFAIFDMDAALDIVDAYSYDTWILSGHSLGGAMAASCAAENPGTFDGLVLLAAYSTEELDGAVPWAVSLYGSEDGVLNMDSVEEGRELMPSDYEEVCIEGGNHALFGSYGEQDGDGEATISAEEQRQAVVDAVIGHLFS